MCYIKHALLEQNSSTKLIIISPNWSLISFISSESSIVTPFRNPKSYNQILTVIGKIHCTHEQSYRLCSARMDDKEKKYHSSGVSRVPQRSDIQFRSLFLNFGAGTNVISFRQGQYLDPVVLKLAQVLSPLKCLMKDMNPVCRKITHTQTMSPIILR